MMKFAVAGLALMTSLGMAQAQSSEVDLAIYPEAKAGMIRHVITLPEDAHEDNLKVEIYAGKTLMVDCNIVVIGADLEEEDVKGWGYPYYVVEDVKEPVQTMMACPKGEKIEEIVGLNFGDDALVRYNSKLPLVVYAPENLTVGYRLWQTDGEIRK